MAKAKTVKSSELEVGKDYFLCYNKESGPHFRATFMFREDGIYFKPLEPHIFLPSSVHKGLVGFCEEMLLGEGFLPVENN